MRGLTDVERAHLERIHDGDCSAIAADAWASTPDNNPPLDSELPSLLERRLVTLVPCFNVDCRFARHPVRTPLGRLALRLPRRP